jgi:hypothetical protein
MFSTKRRRVISVVGAAVAVLAIAGAAFAYFTSTGSTTGTATVGSVNPAGQFTVADRSVPAALYPGTGSFPITGTITNPTKANLGLATATVNITAPTVAGGAAAGSQACSASDFALSVASGSGWQLSNSNDTATYSYANANELANGANTPIPTGLTVSMVDQSYNQDNCEGATVNWTDGATS